MFSALKYGQGEKGTINIGDVIQTIAVMQFIPRVDYYVDRDRLLSYSTLPQSFLLVTGWFLKDIQYFPPPDNIKPFYIGFHIKNPDMLTPRVIEHFKMYEPIGCRDYFTLELLRSRGISSYFSGCISLTFQNSFVGKRENIYIVDIDKEIIEIIPKDIRDNAIYLSHRNFPNVLYKDFPILFFKRIALKGHLPKMIRNFSRLHGFLKSIRMLTSEKFKKYYPAIWDFPKDVFTLTTILYAHLLLDIYARAKLVITKRIHCALPCLALGTPVILLKTDDVSDPSRLEAYEALAPVYTRDKIEEINWNPKPVDISAHANFLRNICREAVKIKGNPIKAINQLNLFK